MNRVGPRRPVFSAVAGIALAVLAACGPSDPAPRGPAVLENKVTGFKFQPTPQHVHVGDTVRWTNLDQSQHTSTSDSEGGWDSPRLDRSGGFEHRFAAAGDFKYHCAVHPFMHGEVVVDRV